MAEVLPVLRIKRRSALILPLTVLAVAFAFWMRVGPVIPVDGAAAQTYQTVELDPGHGGADGGAVGRNGTQEKDVNLTIAAKTSAFLQFFGVDVVMTRTDDRSLHWSGAETLRQQKIEDLQRRCAFTMQQKSPIYLSIHQNFYADMVSHGAQTFYSSKNTGGKSLAEMVQNDLKKVLGAENSRKAAPNPNKNYLLDHLTCPAVIVECGFLSHPEEEAKLCSADYQNQLAFSIAMSAMRAIGEGLAP